MPTTRNLWPLGIIGAFVVFFCGIATVIVIAATHRESLVNANYYEQELKFQDRIDSAARAEKVRATLTFAAAPGHLNLALPLTHLRQNLSGKIALYRPSDPKLDRELPWTPQADGTQMVDVSKFAAGAWRVRVQWNADGKDYFLEQKITI